MKNVSVFQFVTNQEHQDYDAVLFAMKPKNDFLGKSFDVNKLPYINTRRSLKLLQSDQTWETMAELFTISFECSLDEFWNAKITEYYAARNFLLKEWKRIFEYESKVLTSSIVDKNKSKWEQAGIKRLESFNDVLSLDQLAKRYNCYPFDLGRKPYSEVFYLLALAKTDNEINYNFNQIQ